MDWTYHKQEEVSNWEHLKEIQLKISNSKITISKKYSVNELRKSVVLIIIIIIVILPKDTLKKQMRIRTTVKTTEGWRFFFIVGDFFQISEILSSEIKARILRGKKKNHNSVLLVVD